MMQLNFIARGWAIICLATTLMGARIARASDSPGPAPTGATMPIETTRIALVSDTHTTRSTEGDKALYKGRLDKVVAAVNAAHPDVVLIAGDLTDDGHAEQFADFKAQIKGFQAQVLLVPGNHDIGPKIMPGTLGGITAQRLTAYEAVFGASYYLSIQPHLRILGINASLFGSGLPQEAQQWAFLDKELGQPAATSTVLFMHYPPFLKTADEPGGTYWNIEPAPRRRLLALVKSGKMRAVLTGHLHRPLLNQREGVSYITTPPVSFGLPKGKHPQGWTLVTITAQGAVRSENQYIAD